MILLAALAAASPAPAAVLQDYYALLRARRYAAAYRLWEGDGRASGQSYAAFRRGYARTVTTRVVIAAPGRPEGAAGSNYVELPVVVSARLTDGTRQRFAGRYVLRRVNDVPGSSLAARRWHIHAATLRASPGG